MKIEELSQPVPNTSAHWESICGGSTCTELNPECWLDKRKLNCSGVIAPGLDLEDEYKVDIAVFYLHPNCPSPSYWIPTSHCSFMGSSHLGRLLTLCVMDLYCALRRWIWVLFYKDVYISAGSVQKDGCLGKPMIREKAFANNPNGMT